VACADSGRPPRIYLVGGVRAHRATPASKCQVSRLGARPRITSRLSNCVPHTQRSVSKSMLSSTNTPMRRLPACSMGVTSAPARAMPSTG
jgi:hypothetical protein